MKGREEAVAEGGVKDVDEVEDQETTPKLGLADGEEEEGDPGRTQILLRTDMR